MEQVNHPSHYGGADNDYESIKVIEAWNLGFKLGNVIKYVSRAGNKNPGLPDRLEDLEKAQWYLVREIEQLEQRISEATLAAETREKTRKYGKENMEAQPTQEDDPLNLNGLREDMEHEADIVTRPEDSPFS